MSFLVHWLIYAVAIVITAYLLPGVRLSGFFAALVTALVLGLVNTFLKPLLILLTLPLNILTLGLLTFVINAVMLLLTSWITGKLDVQFHVDGFWNALLGAFIITVVGVIINAVLPDKAEIK